MALTRAFLRGMNLTDEQVSAIIEAHTESTDSLKAQRDTIKEQMEQYKAEANKLVDVQKELNDLKAKDDGGWRKSITMNTLLLKPVRQMLRQRKLPQRRENRTNIPDNGRLVTLANTEKIPEPLKTLGFVCWYG